MIELFGFVWWMIIFDLSLDLMPHGDIKSRVTKKTFRWVLIPSICSQPIMGKGLLRLPPFYAKCLLISASDLWTSLPRAFIDVGVPPNTPSVWYCLEPISWLLLRTVCCFADLFNPSRNDQRVLICLRHWGWSRPCSAHHQWVSGIRFALAQTHPFLSEGKPRISTVLRQTIESVHVERVLKRSPGWGPHGEKDQSSFSNNIYPRYHNSRLNMVIWIDFEIIASQRFMAMQYILGIWLVLALPSGP